MEIGQVVTWKHTHYRKPYNFACELLNKTIVRTKEQKVDDLILPSENLKRVNSNLNEHVQTPATKKKSSNDLSSSNELSEIQPGQSSRKSDDKFGDDGKNT